MNTAGCAHMLQPLVLVVLFDNRYTHCIVVSLRVTSLQCMTIKFDMQGIPVTSFAMSSVFF